MKKFIEFTNVVPGPTGSTTRRMIVKTDLIEGVIERQNSDSGINCIIMLAVQHAYCAESYETIVQKIKEAEQ